ncbi:MAG: hypothetical protein KGL53_15710, partial [Elusimicrobia bacterium]|nr:hypothetical protein [Elusimicrobiota bacterium]
MVSRWWLWLNLLSLDAPLVLAAWRLLVDRAAGLRPEWAAVLAWSVGVWGVYLADRLLDSLKDGAAQTLPARHRFNRSHRAALGVLLAAACAAAMWLAWTHIELRLLRVGLALTPVVAVYFAVVHFLPPPRRVWFPKELAVALVFAVGCFSPAMAGIRLPAVATAAAFAIFVLLCWVNCAVIECSEWVRLRGMGAGEPHPWSRVLGRRAAA